MQITGPEFKLAVTLAGGQKKVSQMLGVSRDTVNRWQNGGVEPRQEPRVRYLMGPWLPVDGEPPAPASMNPLLYVSNLDLLAEVARRLAVAERVQQADGGVVTSSEPSSTLPQRAGAPGKIGGLPPQE